MNDNNTPAVKTDTKPDRTNKKAKIIIVPHYVGTEKAEKIIENIITEEIRKKLDKNA